MTIFTLHMRLTQLSARSIEASESLKLEYTTLVQLPSHPNFGYNFILSSSSSELTWQKNGISKNASRAMLDLLHSVSKPTVMPYLPIQMSNGHVLRVGDKRPRLPSTLNDTTQEKPMSKCNFLKVFDTNWPTNWCLFFKFRSKFQTYWHYLLSLFLCNL